VRVLAAKVVRRGPSADSSGTDPYWRTESARLRTLLRPRPAKGLAGLHCAIGALLGQAKKRNQSANPNDVRRICLELIGKI
jgi:hypothetical protein